MESARRCSASSLLRPSSTARLASARRRCSRPPDVDPSELASLSREAREGVYRAVLGLVRLDGRVTSEEGAWLDKLREHLGLDAETRARIERE